MLLKKHGMYAENSGGLALNSGYPELGLNPELLRAFKEIGVAMLPRFRRAQMVRYGQEHQRTA
jgi:hypothetical protein